MVLVQMPYQCLYQGKWNKARKFLETELAEDMNFRNNKSSKESKNNKNNTGMYLLPIDRKNKINKKV